MPPDFNTLAAPFHTCRRRRRTKNIPTPTKVQSARPWNGDWAPTTEHPPAGSSALPSPNPESILVEAAGGVVTGAGDVTPGAAPVDVGCGGVTGDGATPVVLGVGFTGWSTGGTLDEAVVGAAPLDVVPLSLGVVVEVSIETSVPTSLELTAPDVSSPVSPVDGASPVSTRSIHT